MTKVRIGITLERNLLKKIDEKINRTSVRNRSHFIETILEREMNEKTTT